MMARRMKMDFSSFGEFRTQALDSHKNSVIDVWQHRLSSNGNTVDCALFNNSGPAMVMYKVQFVARAVRDLDNTVIINTIKNRFQLTEDEIIEVLSVNLNLDRDDICALVNFTDDNDEEGRPAFRIKNQETVTMLCLKHRIGKRYLP